MLLKPPAGIARDRCRVLVVDDEPAILHDYRQAFAAPVADSGTLNYQELASELFGGGSGSDGSASDPSVVHEPVSFDLVVCAQGHEAVEAVRAAEIENRPFSVAFIDVRMPPGIDGVTAAAQMRAIDPFLNTVIVTGYSDFTRKEIAGRLSPGNFFYFHKPFLADEFMQLAWALHIKRMVETDYRTLNTSLHDEVERRSADIQVALHQALDGARAKSTFLSNMSHELRTPLNAIIGFSDIIQNQLFGPVGEVRYVDYAADIHTSALHLLNLINDVLDYSKIEAGGMPLSESAADIDHMIEFSINLLRIRAGQKSIEIKHKPMVPAVALICDERRVKQVLLNLIVNAIKFTPVNGTIEIGATRISASDPLVKVVDSGVGMTKEEAARAFEPFIQVDDAFTRSQEGTGLGLPISLSLMKLHDGDLTIDSAPRQGTTVTIRFPATRVRGARADSKLLSIAWIDNPEKCCRRSLIPLAAGSFGGPDQNRTDDLLIANEALSQLSYGPTRWDSGARPERAGIWLGGEALSSGG